LTLALNENKLQVGKRTDSHINRKKRKKSRLLRKSTKLLSHMNIKILKKEKLTIDGYEN